MTRQSRHQRETPPKRISIQIPMSPPHSSRVSALSPVSATSFSSSVASNRDPASVSKCPTCTESFSVFKRRYQCPYCFDVVCRKCSKSLRKIQHHDTGIPRVSSNPTSPMSDLGDSHDFDDTASLSSNSSISSITSPTNRRIKQRCCSNCATFASISKPPPKCEICHSTAAIFRKKKKCQICQKFACKPCGDEQESEPFGIKTSAKIWVCIVCTKTQLRQRAKSQMFCQHCKSKFAEFQRRCQCHTCGATTCVQCSVSAQPIEEHKLDTRECRQCFQSRQDMEKSSPPSSSRSIRLNSKFEFSNERTSSFGSSMRTIEHSCAGIAFSLGLIIVLCIFLLAYFYFVSSFVQESWISEWYHRHMVTTRRGTHVDATSPKGRSTTPKGRSTTPKKLPRKKANQNDQESLTLQHILVLFRHGDRTPITTQVGEHLVMDEAQKELWASKLPTDEHIETLSKGAKVTGMELHLPPPKDPRDGGVFPNGQLTVRGLTQLEEKGKGLREHYLAFLKDIHQDEIYIRSTNVRRTIRSCLSLLHGCFPELVGEDRLCIRINPDVTLEPTFTQADYGRLLARYKDPSRQASLPPLPESVGCTTTLDEKIRQVIGIPQEKPICYTSLREVLVCRNAHDVPYPIGMDEQMYQKLVDYNTWEFHTLFGDDNDCHDGFSNGVEEIFNLLHGVAKGELKQRASLMAVHDSTLIALWNAMKLEVGIVFPVYAALTSIELYTNEAGKWFLKVKVDHEPIHFKGHKHALITPFEHLETIVNKFLAKKKREAEVDDATPSAKRVKKTE